MIKGIETKAITINHTNTRMCDVSRGCIHLLQLIIITALLFVPLVSVEAQQIAEGIDFSCFITDEPHWAYDYPVPLPANATLASIDCFGGPQASLVLSSAPKLVGPFIQIAAGPQHVIGLLQNGSVVVWGGLGPTGMIVPDSVKQSHVIKVTAGNAHSCVQLDDFSVECFGLHVWDELNVPQDIQFRDIAAGSGISCGITLLNASILCYGSNTSSQLSNIPASDPYDDFVQISASPTAEFICVLRHSGRILCWGGSTGASLPDIRKASEYPNPCAISVSTAPQSDFPCMIECGSGTLMCLERSGKGYYWTQQWLFSDVVYAQFGLQVALSTSGHVEGNNIYTRKNSVVQVGPTSSSALYTDGVLRAVYLVSPSNLNIVKYTAAESGACGITNTSTIICMGDASYLSAQIQPTDSFTAVSLSYYPTGAYSFYSLVAVNSFGRLQFFGYNSDILANATASSNPPVLRNAWSTAFGGCGWVVADGTIVCFGNQTINTTLPLPNRPFGSIAFSDVTYAFGGSGLKLCGIQTSDSTIACTVVDVFNPAQPPTSFDIPAGLQFISISVIGNLFCGILLSNSTIFCTTTVWQNLNVPSGIFARVTSIEGMNVCGIRADASMICTGQIPVKPPSFALPTVASMAPAYSYQSGNSSIPCPVGSYGRPGYITPLCGGPCSSGADCKLGCNEGYYCVLGVADFICPRGSYCPANTYNNPLPCPVGRYGATQGLTNSSCSGDCPPKYFCLQGTSDYSTMLCPLGHFCNITATLIPQPCDVGYLGNMVGNDGPQCNGPCPPGYLCKFGTSSLVNTSCPVSYFCPQPATSTPTICPVGHYCSGGSVSPALCAPGTYGITEGLSTINCSAPCPAGFLCFAGSTTFIDSVCPASWACPVVGTTNATKQLCSPGYYCPSQSVTSKQITCGSRSVYCPPGSSTPIPIDSGSYGLFNASAGESETSQSGQMLCQKGHFCDGSGVMKPCAAGQYSESVGAATCVPCTVGQYAGAVATTCTSCQAGKYSSYPDTPCAACGAGTYSQSKSASCTPCDAGTASADVGRNTSCVACDSGTYADRAGLTSCFTCSPPFYTPTASLCILCNTIVSPDSRSCINSVCASNSQLNVATRTCELCPLSFYSVTGGICISCPIGLYTPSVASGCHSCSDSSGLSCNAGYASVKEGYWAFRETDPDTGLSLFRTVECPVDFCKGGLLQQIPATVNLSMIASEDSAATDPSELTMLFALASQCEFPRAQTLDNYMCGKCADGYEMWAGRCQACEHSNGGLLVLAFFLSLALVLFFIRSAVLASSTQASSSTNAALSIIVLYFIQTAAIEIGPVSRYLSWFQLANFGLQSTSSGSNCIAPLSPHQQLLFAMILPFIFIVEIMVVGMFHFCVSNSGACQGEEGQLNGNEVQHLPVTARLRRFFNDFNINIYVGSAMSSLLFCYTGVASACLAYFGCADVAGARVLSQYPSINCDSSDYKQGLAIAIVMLLLFIIGFPLCTMLFLWSRASVVHASHQAKKRSLREAGAADAMSEGASISPPVERASVVNCGDARSPSASVIGAPVDESTLTFLRRFGLLFSIYHESAWHWQCVILLRRGLFVAAAAALSSSPTFKFMTFIYLNLASLALQLYVKPFQSDWLNHVEVASNSLLVIISVLLQTGAPFSIGVQVILLLLLVIPLFTLFVMVIRRNYVKITIKRRGREPPRQQQQSGNGELAEHRNEHVQNRAVSSANDVELTVVNPFAPHQIASPSEIAAASIASIDNSEVDRQMMSNSTLRSDHDIAEL